jgi:hypothetical protein
MGFTRRIVRTIRRAIADSPSVETRHVNVSRPRNVVITSNVGEGASTQAASTRQRVRVRQEGEETYEETETTETRWP